MSPPRGWKRPFTDPIPLPRGRQLVALEDAGNYITRLSKAEHEAQEWQAAMEALILVATSGGPTMSARIGIMRALNRNVKWGDVRYSAAIGGKAEVTRTSSNRSSEPRWHFPGCCFPAGHVPVDIRKRQGSFDARRRMERQFRGADHIPFRPFGG